MAIYLRTVNGRQVCVRRNRLPIECFRCGVCCVRYQPPVDKREIQAMARGLGMTSADFAGKYVQTTIVGYLLRREDAACVFLKRDGNLFSCSVHEYRPDACRDWEPALDRPECRAGLIRLQQKGNILLPGELYPSGDALERFAQSLHVEKVPK